MGSPVALHDSTNCDPDVMVKLSGNTVTVGPSKEQQGDILISNNQALQIL